jgi:hypothetical protein
MPFSHSSFLDFTTDIFLILPQLFLQIINPVYCKFSHIAPPRQKITFKTTKKKTWQENPSKAVKQGEERNCRPSKYSHM